MMTRGARAIGWLACVGLLVGAAGSASAQPAASVWPLFHGDPQRTGRSTAVGPASATNVRVAFESFGTYRSSPVIGPDGTVYAASGRKLCAIDPSDDSVKWCSSIGGTAALASPAVGVDPLNPSRVLIYQGDRGNHLNVFDQDGVMRWQYPVGVDGDVATSPVISPSGTVFFGGSLRMHSISPTGTLNWVEGLDGPIEASSPALSPSGDAVYVGTIGGSLYSFAPNGTQNWRITVGKNIRFAGAAVADDGTIYIGTRNGLVSVTDNGMSATINWTYPMSGRGVVSTPAIAPDGTVYVGGRGLVAGGQATFFAINPDASTAWTWNTTKFFRGSPVLDAAGRIYTTSGREVIALDGTNPGDPLLWRYAVKRNLFSTPALDADGTLWITGADRKLYAISD